MGCFNPPVIPTINDGHIMKYPCFFWPIGPANVFQWQHEGHGHLPFVLAGLYTLWGPGNYILGAVATIYDMHWYAGDFATALYDISFFVFSFPGLRHRTGDYPIYIHSICLKSILVASVCKGFWVIAWPLHTQCIAGQRFVSQMDSAWVFRFPSDLHLGHMGYGGYGPCFHRFFWLFPSAKSQERSAGCGFFLGTDPQQHTLTTWPCHWPSPDLDVGQNGRPREPQMLV